MLKIVRTDRKAFDAVDIEPTVADDILMQGYLFKPRTARKNFRKHFFRIRAAWKVFGNDRAHRCDEFRPKIVPIGAILAIFRLFEIFQAV